MLRARYSYAFCAISLFGIVCSAEAQVASRLDDEKSFVQNEALVAEKYDLVIQGGRVVDGTGSPWYAADFAIVDGKIKKIGRIKKESANTTKAISCWKRWIRTAVGLRRPLI